MGMCGDYLIPLPVCVALMEPGDVLATGLLFLSSPSVVSDGLQSLCDVSMVCVLSDDPFVLWLG